MPYGKSVLLKLDICILFVIYMLFNINYFRFISYHKQILYIVNLYYSNFTAFVCGKTFINFDRTFFKGSRFINVFLYIWILNIVSHCIVCIAIEYCLFIILILNFLWWFSYIFQDVSGITVPLFHINNQSSYVFIVVTILVVSGFFH